MFEAVAVKMREQCPSCHRKTALIECNGHECNKKTCEKCQIEFMCYNCYELNLVRRIEYVY